jgi:hypothetical protein
MPTSENQNTNIVMLTLRIIASYVCLNYLLNNGARWKKINKKVTWFIYICNLNSNSLNDLGTKIYNTKNIIFYIDGTMLLHMLLSFYPSNYKNLSSSSSKWLNNLV